jgi:hypothetical protein
MWRSILANHHHHDDTDDTDDLTLCETPNPTGANEPTVPQIR